MKPYYIWAPGFNNLSGGIKVLHKLCHELNSAGCTAYVNVRDVHPQWNTPFGIPGPEQDYIAVYPEIVQDNPFNAKNIVRWILYLQRKEYAPGEIIIPFMRMFNSLGLPEERILYLPAIETEIFHDPKLPRQGRCFYLGKGAHTPRVRETDGLFQVSQEHARDPVAFAKRFQEMELFYCYDNMSAVMDIARLCGCPVVMIPNGTFSKEEYQKHELGLDGLGYGIEETEHAVATQDSAKFRDRYHDLIRLFHVRLKRFIELTQTSFA